LPTALKRAPKPEVTKSKALSLLARPGQEGIKTRRIALILANGVKGEAAMMLHRQLMAAGAVPRFVGVKLGRVDSENGEPVEIEVSMETAPAVVWDAMAILDGGRSVEELANSGHALEFLKDQYRHCKPILLLGKAEKLLAKAGIPPALPSGKPDPGLLMFGSDDIDAALRAFVGALSKHRQFERETDPPRV
jgi:catalase